MKNKTAYTKATANFIVAEVSRPNREPIEALKALFVFVLSKSISPIKAPEKAPINIPNGMGENKPISNPMVVPYAPYLLPPKRFVPIAGIM
tara:strand:- start:5 stop:277 length:273 start_codon:yes stop_codon:yes gene_type:complete